MERLTYDQVFGKLVKAAWEGRLPEEQERLRREGDDRTRTYVTYASGEGDGDRVVYKVEDCRRECCAGNRYEMSCLFNAIARDEEGNVVIRENCIGCGRCIDICDYGALVDRKEFVPLVSLLKERSVPVYAIVAPAFVGQFGPEATPGKVRAALKRIGFYGMVEVALFADVLTLKEALEFDIHVRSRDDFVLTSCCCPMWIGLIRRVFRQLIPHVSPSVSPMVACGRAIKRLHPEAKIVFIGPCIAKKGEAKDPDVRDAVDAVLTFQETAQIFAALDIDPKDMEEDESEHSSLAGRVYARTGGVSRAVSDTLSRIRPDKPISVNAVQANGIMECRDMLRSALEGESDANFYEGMGCIGGCVGGPKAILDRSLGTDLVNAYGDLAEDLTPADNRYVLETLRHLGFAEIDDLLNGPHAAMFQRSFGETETASS